MINYHYKRLKEVLENRDIKVVDVNRGTTPTTRDNLYMHCKCTPGVKSVIILRETKDGISFVPPRFVLDEDFPVLNRCYDAETSDYLNHLLLEYIVNEEGIAEDLREVYRTYRTLKLEGLKHKVCVTATRYSYNRIDLDAKLINIHNREEDIVVPLILTSDYNCIYKFKYNSCDTKYDKYSINTKIEDVTLMVRHKYKDIFKKKIKIKLLKDICYE